MIFSTPIPLNQALTFSIFIKYILVAYVYKDVSSWGLLASSRNAGYVISGVTVTFW